MKSCEPGTAITERTMKVASTPTVLLAGTMSKSLLVSSLGHDRSTDRRQSHATFAALVDHRLRLNQCQRRAIRCTHVANRHICDGRFTDKKLGGCPRSLSGSLTVVFELVFAVEIPMIRAIRTLSIETGDLESAREEDSCKTESTAT
jgi:hypothetical protein